MSESIDDMLERLRIEEEEFDDLVFEEEEAPKEGIKWMALCRIHSTNYFSAESFEQHMRVAWSPVREIQFQHIKGNLFTVQCFCLGDSLKVSKGGPWLFRQPVVCIEPYDGLLAPEKIDLNLFETWVQIHKLSVGYRNKTLITNLTEKKVGKVVEVQTDVQGAGNFVRVRVRMDVRKVLARFVSMVRGGQREIYQVKFEKMPRFCGTCGLIGHSHLECGPGEHDEEKLKWGNWLKADWETWAGRGPGGVHGGCTGRGGRDNRGGRGRDMQGPGRGEQGNQANDLHKSWSFNALTYPPEFGKEDELADTVSSPAKNDVAMEERESTDSGVKRRLRLEGINPEVVAIDERTEGVAMVLDGDGLPQKDDTIKECTKRPNKDGANSTSLGSVGSQEEPVRSQ
jgi:hypothetical protein